MNKVKCKGVAIVTVRDVKAPRVPFACSECDYVTHSKQASSARSSDSVDCRNARNTSSIKPPRLG